MVVFEGLFSLEGRANEEVEEKQLESAHFATFVLDHVWD